MKIKITYPTKILLNMLIVSLFSSILHISFAQDVKASKEAKKYMAEASAFIENDNFADAEAALRKAISIDPENKKAAYNFGNLYINNEKNRNAFQRLAEAVSENDDKAIKHKSFHNQGNIFMKEERYSEAVEAYKNALRNNPTDEETRYNLALAKQKLKEKGGDGGDGDDQENQKLQDQEQNKDGEGENEQENEGEKEESENKDNKEGDNKDQKNEGEGDKEPKEGDQQEKEQEQPQQGKSPNQDQKGDKKQPPPQQMQGKLSPEQLKNLLEAIENQEKNIQDKLNAEKRKGKKVKTEKDW